jgi:PAS domain S-box-containing protein
MDLETKGELTEEVEALRERAMEAVRERVEWRDEEDAPESGELAWQVVAEAIPSFILVLDRDGTIQYVNRTVSGITPQEAIGTNFSQYVPPEQLDAVRRSIEGVFLNGESDSYVVAGGVDPGAATTWYETHIGPIKQEGEVVAVALVSTDISLRRKAEEAQRDRENRLRSLFESSPDFVVEIDREGRILFINRTVPEMTLEETIGTSCYDYIVPEHRDAYVEIVERVFQTGQGNQIETAGLGPGGRTAFYETRFSPVKVEDEVLSVMMVARDVTEAKQAKEALVESEQRYRDLYQEAPIAYFSLRAADGSIRRCNRAALCLLGYDWETISQVKAFDLYADTPEGKGRAREVFQRFKAGESIRDIELQMRRGDGGTLWVSLSVEPIFGDDGAVVESRSMAVDITERKAAEEALKQSQRRLRTVIKAAPMILWAIDPSGIIRFSDGRALEMLGLQPGQLVGQSVFDVYRGYPEALAAIKQGLSGEEFTLDVEVGGHFWENSYIPQRDEAGKVKGLVGISIDVTDRRAARQAIQQSERRFRALVENAPDAVVLVDATGALRFVSPAFTQILGYDQSDFVEMSPLEFIHPEDLALATTLFGDLVKEPGGRRSGEVRVRSSDGSIRWCEATGTNHLHDPAIQAMVVNLRDITDRKWAEEELLESEERFRMLAEASLVGIFIIQGTAFSYVNAAAANMFGYDAAEMIGQLGPMELTHPEGHAPSGEYMMSCLSGQAPKTPFSIRGIHRDGHSIDCELMASGVNIKGETAIVGTIVEVTERKQAEENAERDRRFFESIINLSSEGMVVLNPDMTIGFISAVAREASGYVGEDTVSSGTMGFDFIHPEDQPRVMEIFMKELQNPNRGKPVFVEFRTSRLDGTWQWFECAATSLFHNPDVQGMVINLRDLTERKDAEQALRDREERFRSLIENASDAITILGPDGTIAYRSPSARSMLGYGPQDDMEDSMMEHVHPEDLPVTMDSLAIVAEAAGNKASLEMRLRHADGSWRWVEGIAKNLLEDPKVGGIVCNYRDVTDRHRAQEELRQYALNLSAKNLQLDEAREALANLNENLEQNVCARTEEVETLLRQKDAFIDQLGHDLKSPLTPIVALLPVILENEQDSSQKELLDVVQVNIHFMQELVAKTLFLAKLNARASKIVLEDINLSDQLGSFARGRSMIAEQKGVSVEAHVPDDIIVRGDPLAIRETLDHLVNNAFKFTPEDGAVHVRAETDGPFAVVSVTDTGTGMTEEELSHVFEEFYKADASRHELSSSGLGLAICRRIVEQHGGTIWAESPGLGQGSSVYFTLRLAEVHGEVQGGAVEAGSTQ